MPRWGSLQKFLGKTVSDTASYAAGGAIQATLEPELQEITNQAWAKYQSLPLEPDSAADVVAEYAEDDAWGHTEAAKSGLSPGAFDALRDTHRTAPDFGQLLTMLRRGEIQPAQFLHGLDKAKLEKQWTAPLTALQHAKLSPEDLATAITRGLVHAPFTLPYTPDDTPGKVPDWPTYDIDVAAEAAAWGVDTTRLAIMTGMTGRPISPVEAAMANFRGIIEKSDYNRAIAEGDIRSEWRDAIYESSRQILTSSQYVEAFLRNWIDEGAMRAGAAKHGMVADDADLLAKLSGRPISFHQVFIGLARGGTYDGDTSGIDPAFLKSLQESSIRPEWYNLAWSQRYTYPSTFVLRSMATLGDLTEAQTHQILLYEGWQPDLAATVAHRWATAGNAAQKAASASDYVTLYDGQRMTYTEAVAALVELGYEQTTAQRKLDVADARRVSSARSTTISDLHGAFKKGELNRTEVLGALDALKVPTWSATLIVDSWTAYLAAFPPPKVTPPTP